MQLRSLQSVVEKECEERLALTDALAHAKEQLLAVAVVRSRDPSLAAGSPVPVSSSDTLRSSRSTILLQQASREPSSSQQQSGAQSQSQASSASSMHTRVRPPAAAVAAGSRAIGERKVSLPPLPPSGPVPPAKRTNGLVPSLSLLHMLDSRK